ncbi:hypothetical protein RQ479_27230 [Mesorhizobium sp. ISC25]|uniref:hypothetical protein n=1 Tax=Mesorhizobium sp. ISC25 TaxID=3077335 RepID=UPI0035D8AC4F
MVHPIIIGYGIRPEGLQLCQVHQLSLAAERVGDANWHPKVERQLSHERCPKADSRQSAPILPLRFLDIGVEFADEAFAAFG